MNLRTAFQSVTEETPETKLDISGQLPSWLNGTLIRNGPALFQAGQQPLNHWFDGFALLHRFHFHNGQVNYHNKFLQSDSLSAAQDKQKCCYEEFASLPKRNILEKLWSKIHPSLTDNANVNISVVNGHHVAMTETTHYVEFDPNSLDTLGHFNFTDKFSGVLTTAHPQYDFAEQVFYNLTISIGPTCYYHFYKVNAGSITRKLIAKIPTKNPAYIHSFAMTPRYLILIETPLRTTGKQFILNREAFIENYHWNESLATQLTIIDKNTGDIVVKTETEACFMFHQINAYEQGNTVIVDLPTFNDASIIQQFYLQGIEERAFSQATAKRLTINLANKRTELTTLIDQGIELPNINYKHINTEPYQFAYASSNKQPGEYLNQLVKLDMRTGNFAAWNETDYICGEPVFVAAPKTNEEDHGIILSMIFNTEIPRTQLLVIDAQSFTEMARATLPQAVPIGLHGQFYT
tara:strand:- start:32216 stop:33607 length:1392 start_codon:yes stop_codon:yes gene_type:complete